MSKFILGLVAVCFVCVGCGGDTSTKSTGTAKTVTTEVKKTTTTEVKKTP